MIDYKKIIAENRKAGFEYFIEEKIEAGIVLTGSEVKSIRNHKITIADSHAMVNNGELYLYNCYIAEYEEADRLNHNTKRPRKLLLNSYELRKLIGKIKLKGYTLTVLKVYFNKKNLVKIELGLARGKKQYDKRHVLKEQDWQREQGKLMRKKIINEY